MTILNFPNRHYSIKVEFDDNLPPGSLCILRDPVKAVSCPHVEFEELRRRVDSAVMSLLDGGHITAGDLDLAVDTWTSADEDMRETILPGPIDKQAFEHHSLIKEAQNMTEKTQAEALKDAVMLGASMGAASAGGDVLLDLAKNLGKDIPAVQVALQSEDGRELIKALLALAVHTLADRTQLVPKAELVKKGMETQISASSMRLAQKHMATLFQALPKLLESDLVKNAELTSGTRCRVEALEEEEAELHACDNVSELKAAVAD